MRNAMIATNNVNAAQRPVDTVHLPSRTDVIAIDMDAVFKHGSAT